MGLQVRSSGSGVNSSPNVVPMIDVMLVLLIIFMIVVPTLSAGFTAVPPQGVNLKPHPEEDEDQVLGIDAEGRYYLNRAPIREEDLGPRLQEIFRDRTTDRFLYVKAHKDLDYAKVLDALDLASRNDVRVAGLITEQQPGTVSAVPTDRLLPSAGPPAGGQH